MRRARSNESNQIKGISRRGDDRIRDGEMRKWVGLTGTWVGALTLTDESEWDPTFCLTSVFNSSSVKL